MNVIQVPFEDVFDCRVSYAPKAIIGLALEDFVGRRQLIIEEGEDGLDSFKVVPLFLKIDDVRRLKFALWRHEGNPKDTFSINFGLPELDVPGLLGLVLQQLDIPTAAVVWRASERSGRFRTEERPSKAGEEAVVSNKGHVNI